MRMAITTISWPKLTLPFLRSVIATIAFVLDRVFVMFASPVGHCDAGPAGQQTVINPAISPLYPTSTGYLTLFNPGTPTPTPS